MKNSDNLKWQMDLSMTLNVLGDLMRQNGDRHSSEQYYEEAFCLDIDTLPKDVLDKMGISLPKKEGTEAP